MQYFAVDAFTDKLFTGNPAGVCLLEAWLPNETLQSIAAENNLSETAFLVRNESYYDLRWFTPELEVDLCGHATMASAFILFNFIETKANELRFMTKSGLLTVTRADGEMIWMDFPARPAVPVPNYQSLIAAFGTDDFQTYRSNDIMAVFSKASDVEFMDPDFMRIKDVKNEAGMPSDDYGVIVTAPGIDCDFVSRFFAPSVGVFEDPVTGRAHCVLTPYWAERLGKTSLTARQLSARGGQLWCEAAGDRVRIGGQARLYLSGQLHV